jgi:hypothetical protein
MSKRYSIYKSDGRPAEHRESVSKEFEKVIAQYENDYLRDFGKLPEYDRNGMPMPSWFQIETFILDPNWKGSAAAGPRIQSWCDELPENNGYESPDFEECLKCDYEIAMLKV